MTIQASSYQASGIQTVTVQTAGFGAKGEPARVVVFGGGAASAEFVTRCLREGVGRTRVQLVSPWACPELVGLARAGRISWSRRNHHPGDLVGAVVAFAGSVEGPVNQAVRAEAERCRISCLDRVPPEPVVPEQRRR